MYVCSKEVASVERVLGSTGEVSDYSPDDVSLVARDILRYDRNPTDFVNSIFYGESFPRRKDYVDLISTFWVSWRKAGGPEDLRKVRRKKRVSWLANLASSVLGTG